MSQSRFETLLDRYQNGDVGPADMAELEQLLRSDPALRTLFVEQVLLQAHLHKACLATSPAVAGSSWRRRLGYAAGWAAAAVLVLALGMGLVSWVGRSASASEVAFGQVLIDGVAVTRIPDGARFEIGGDKPAVVRLTDGSQAEFQPASQGAIRARTDEARLAVELMQGGGKFQVTHGGGQFRVNTPVGSVTALGTEFTVKLQPKKKKDGSKVPLLLAVRVSDGSVQIEAGGKTHVLAVGDNRAFSDDGQQNNIDDGDQNDNGAQNNPDQSDANQKDDGNQDSKKQKHPKK